MPIDSSLHSIFGVGKVAADIAGQEYGRYDVLAIVTEMYEVNQETWVNRR